MRDIFAFYLKNFYRSVGVKGGGDKTGKKKKKKGNGGGDKTGKNNNKQTNKKQKEGSRGEGVGGGKRKIKNIYKIYIYIYKTRHSYSVYNVTHP